MAVSSLLLASALVFAPTNQTTNEISETPVVEETTTTTEDTSFVDDVKQYVDEHFNLSVILDTLTAILGSGSVFTALGVYLSKRKQGANIEKSVLEVINKQLGTSFASFKDNELKEFIRKQDITQDTLKLMIKALVLAQDKTAEGKKALVDLMLECNEKVGKVDDETTKVLTNAKSEIEKEQIKVVKTQEKVKDDFIPVD